MPLCCPLHRLPSDHRSAVLATHWQPSPAAASPYLPHCTPAWTQAVAAACLSSTVRPSVRLAVGIVRARDGTASAQRARPASNQGLWALDPEPARNGEGRGGSDRRATGRDLGRVCGEVRWTRETRKRLASTYCTEFGRLAGSNCSPSCPPSCPQPVSPDRENTAHHRTGTGQQQMRRIGTRWKR